MDISFRLHELQAILSMLLKFCKCSGGHINDTQIYNSYCKTLKNSMALYLKYLSDSKAENKKNMARINI